MKRLTFAQFMDQALYGPEGYYASGQAQSGRQGDYFTAPDVGPVFGRLLAEIFKEWRTKLALPAFELMEAGAGEGALAQSIRSLWNVPYLAIERSPFRQEKLRSLDIRVLPDLKALYLNPVSGVLFANELLDAFPVHRVRWHNHKLEEAFVEGEKLVWAAPSTSKLAAYFERLQIDLPEGYETEVNLAMAQWFQDAAHALQKGLILLIDYGRPAHEYYSPGRTGGTLRTFQQHHVGTDVLARAGQKDLTADVDFTSAALDAQVAGLKPLAYMTLGSFLMDAVERLPATAERIPGLKYLIHPDGLGDAFHILVLGKNVSLSEKDFAYNRLAQLGLQNGR